MKRIYLDHAATTPVKKEVVQAMLPYLETRYGNPSSIHSFGREAQAAIDQAREKIAKFLNCQPMEIIFTSGGTESDNLALLGTARALKKKGDHIITTAFEHHAVLNTCQQLEKEGFKITYVKPEKNGIVDVKKIQKAIKKETILISVMYANNEIGTVQPIREIGKMIEKYNKNQKSKIENQIYFHTDAVQAIDYLNCDTKYLHVDLLSLSGHKIHGPKGIGALFIKKGTPFVPILYGGEQEFNKRPGTENVASIVGLGKAIELINQKSHQEAIEKIKKLRDKLVKGIIKKIPKIIYNGDPENRLPNNANFCFKGIEGEAILLNLDLAGIAASSGSACTSKSLKPSHVLLAIGVPPRIAQGSIRFTLGEQNTEEEIDYVLEVLPNIIKKLRKISPIKN